MVAISLLIFFLLALSSLFGPMESGSATRWLLAVFTGLTFLPMNRWIREKRIEFFEIIYPVSMSYFLYFVYSTVTSLEESIIDFPWLTQADINQALLSVAMGFCCLLVGYYSRVPVQIARALPAPRLEADPRTAQLAICLLYFVGLCIRLYLLQIGSTTWSVKFEELEYGTVIRGPIASLIGYINQCALFAYVLACTHYFSAGKSRSFAFILWGVMLPAECAWSFLQASKNAFIPVLVAPLIARHFLSKKITIKEIILPTLIFVFLVFPAVTEYRTWAADYPVRLNNLIHIVPEIAARLFKELVTPESETFVAEAPGLLADRLPGLTAVANVVDYVKTQGIIHGQTLWQWWLILVPGIFMPEKDLYLNYGMMFYGVEVFGTYEAQTSGVALMQAGEFYLNYGIWGLLLGMFLQGVFYRIWQEYWGHDNPLTLAVYILGWRMLVLIEIPFCHAYGELLRQTVLMLLFLWLLPRPKTGEAEEEVPAPA